MQVVLGGLGACSAQLPDIFVKTSNNVAYAFFCIFKILDKIVHKNNQCTMMTHSYYRQCNYGGGGGGGGGGFGDMLSWKYVVILLYILLRFLL